MAKTNYPSVINAAYKGLVSEARTVMNRLAGRINRSPGAAAEISPQIAAFMAANGVPITIPGTQRLITSGVKVTAPAITGTYVNGYTLTIANGVITAIVAS